MEDNYIVYFRDEDFLLDAYSGDCGMGTSLETALVNYANCKACGYRDVKLVKYCEVEEMLIYKIKE